MRAPTFPTCALKPTYDELTVRWTGYFPNQIAVPSTQLVAWLPRDDNPSRARILSLRAAQRRGNLCQSSSDRRGCKNRSLAMTSFPKPVEGQRMIPVGSIPIGAQCAPLHTPSIRPTTKFHPRGCPYNLRHSFDYNLHITFHRFLWLHAIFLLVIPF